MIKRETKSVLQLHRIQEAQREKTAAKFQAGMPYMTACVGLCAAFADGVRKHPLPDLRPHLARFCGAFGGQKSLRKTSRIRPVPRSVPRVGFPRQTTDNTGERNEAGESPDALCARPVTSTRSAGGFSGASNSAVFSWPIAR